MSAEYHGQLVPTGGGDPIPLLRDTMTIGRRESCDICLAFPNVSSRHAVLNYHDGFWEIRDTNSTNGIKVNGSRVQKRALKPGDEITIAKRRYVIEYTLQADPRLLTDTIEEDMTKQSLLEKAGLAPNRKGDPDRPRPVDPSQMFGPDENDD